MDAAQSFGVSMDMYQVNLKKNTPTRGVVFMIAILQQALNF